jgi:hypothetical protein
VFLATMLIVAAATYAIVGRLGGSVGHARWPLLPAALLAGGVIGGTWHAWGGGWLPTSQRQMRKEVAEDGRRGALIYGAVLGLGFLTIVSSPFLWIGFVIVAVAGHWLWGAGYGAGFGAGRIAHFLALGRAGAVLRPGTVAVRVVSGRWGWVRAVGGVLGGGLVITGLWLLLQGPGGLSP